MNKKIESFLKEREIYIYITFVYKSVWYASNILDHRHT